MINERPLLLLFAHLHTFFMESVYMYLNIFVFSMSLFCVRKEIKFKQKFLVKPPGNLSFFIKKCSAKLLLYYGKKRIVLFN